MSLKDLPSRDLEAELKRREESRKPKRPEPTSFLDVDWGPVYLAACSYADAVDTEGSEYARSKCRVYVTEAALEAVFGKTFWPWSNSR
jgi:hypothetical protein